MDSRTIFASLLVLAASGSSLVSQTPAVGQPHAEMQRLAFLVGSWDIQIEALDRAGKVIHTSRGRLETTSELGGQLILSLGYADERTPAQRNWKFYHAAKQKLYDVNFDRS